MNRAILRHEIFATVVDMLIKKSIVHVVSVNDKLKMHHLLDISPNTDHDLLFKHTFI